MVKNGEIRLQSQVQGATPAAATSPTHSFPSSHRQEGRSKNKHAGRKSHQKVGAAVDHGPLPR